MSKTILIPTDLTVDSLNSVRIILEENQEPQICILLVCPIYLPDSISEILYYNPKDELEKLMSADFKDGLFILRNRFSNSLKDLRVEVFHGMNGNAFENFMEAHGIDEIVIPSNYKLKRVKNGFDLLPFIKKSNNRVSNVEWTISRNTESQALHRLFRVN